MSNFKKSLAKVNSLKAIDAFLKGGTTRNAKRKRVQRRAKLAKRALIVGRNAAKRQRKTVAKVASTAPKVSAPRSRAKRVTVPSTPAEM